ncbi:Gfo/Idh/MocA family protein [Paenibacillus solisilvae]|uniref:Gfo/Idh/MocA family protein n=1 Tax=Paenibacillus solisilvae TaxID=2486751 RepID=A0ABW0VP08_9BACL
MKTIRAGVIGCGSLGRVHIDCVSKIEGIQMVAYCDIYENKAQALLQEYGGEYATSDVDRFFADETLDAIYVTTLHDTHADYCIRALESGKHVMVEKPLSLTVEDCLRVGETVERTGKKLMTAFKMRYYDLLLKAKELIPQPVMVTMQMMDNRWPDGAWANDPIKGGGNVLSQGCHSTDILRFVASGEPIEVYAAGGRYYQAADVVDNLTAVFRFDNAVAGSLVQGDCNCPRHVSKFFMQIFAENKSVTLTDRLTKLIYQEAGKDPVIFTGTETGFLEENKAFVECIQEDKRPPIDHVDGLYATLMTLQAVKSLRSGKPEPIRSLVDKVLQKKEQTTL